MNKYQITKLARELRKNQTTAEYLLWQNLRNRNLLEVKFFRQHPIIYDSDASNLFFFIPDFYSNEAKLVIEADGKIHDFQKEYDRNRDKILGDLGLRVVRFRNEEVEKDILNVLHKIELAIKDSPLFAKANFPLSKE